MRERIGNATIMVDIFLANSATPEIRSSHLCCLDPAWTGWSIEFQRCEPIVARKNFVAHNNSLGFCGAPKIGQENGERTRLWSNNECED